MKLDIELCRKVLQIIEEKGTAEGLEGFPHVDGEEDDCVFYQIRKMTEAGYVNHKIYGKGHKSDYDYFRVDISFTGHEFLRQMLDDTIWNKTKEVAKKGGMTLTFETVKAIIPIAIQKLTELM